MTSDNPTIGTRVRFLRTRIAGLTRTDFAEKLGSKPINIAVIERDIRKPSEQFLNKFQQAFNVNIDWLRTGTGDVLLSKA